jgi:hypothetical protein
MKLMSAPPIHEAGADLTHGWKIALTPAPVGTDICRISTPIGKIIISTNTSVEKNNMAFFNIMVLSQNFKNTLFPNTLSWAPRISMTISENG